MNHKEEMFLSEAGIRFICDNLILVENLPLGIFRLKFENKEFIEVNKTMVEMFGYEKKCDFLNLSLYDLLYEKEKIKKLIESDFEKGRIKIDDIKFIKKNKDVFIGRFSCVVVKHDNNSIWVDGFIEDISEHKRLLKELEQIKKMETVGLLAGGVAHDFNNILAAVIGEAELNIINNKDNNIKESMTRIIKISKRGANLVKQLMDFSRISVPHRTTVNINDFIEDQIKILKRIVPVNISIEYIKTDLPDKKKYLIFDIVQMQQVFMNLITNSRDAILSDGKIEISVFYKKINSKNIDGKVNIPKGEWCVIYFKDIGEGIKEEHLSKVYDPFFTTKQQGKGTGLGLSQVYGIIKNHNGFIDIKSKIGIGTEVFIYLPVSVEKKRGSELISANDREDIFKGNGETILIVEDEETLRNVLKNIFEKLEYKVIDAKDGKEGLSEFKDNIDRIKLVITDMVMPEMGGIEMFRQIHKIKPDLKVILMTGHAVTLETEELEKEGLYALMQKPPSISRLSRVVYKGVNEIGY